MAAAQKRAGLKVTGALHILRHTFCSHLAMWGGESLRRGDMLETSRGLKAPGPETAEIPAASGPD
jgi:hypothetical protein